MMDDFVTTFYVKNREFQVTNHYLLKNGEVIAEGHIFVHQLVLGVRGMLEVRSLNSHCPPQFIDLGVVESILPNQEFYDNIQNPVRELYRLTVAVKESGHWETRVYPLRAVTKQLACQVLFNRFGHDHLSIKSIKRIQAVTLEERGKTNERVTTIL